MEGDRRSQNQRKSEKKLSKKFDCILAYEVCLDPRTDALSDRELNEVEPASDGSSLAFPGWVSDN